MANKGKPKHLDDIINEIRETPHHKIKESLKLYETHMGEEVQLQHFNELFAPAQDEMYAAMEKQLDDIFKSDTAKLHEKREELQKAVVEGLKAYFSKVQPSIAKAVGELESLEEQYNFLTFKYDEHIGSEKPVMRGLAEGLAKNKEATVGGLKQHLWLQKTEHAQQAQKVLNALAASHYIGTIPAHELAVHLMPKIEKEYTIDDKLQYLLHQHGTLLQIRQGIKKGEWPKGGYKALGLTKKEKEEEEEK